jgi:stress response protein SCP2
MDNFKVALGWDLAGSSIDIDVSVFLLDVKGNLLEMIYYGNLKSNNKSVILSGDN